MIFDWINQWLLFILGGLLPLTIVLVLLAKLVAGPGVKIALVWRTAFGAWVFSLLGYCFGYFVLYSILDVTEAGPGEIFWQFLALLMVSGALGLGVTVVFAVAGRSAWGRCMLAGLLVAVLFPAIILTTLSRVSAVLEAERSAASRKKHSALETRQEVAPADWGIVVPQGWKPENLWANTYGPEFVGIDRSNWEQYGEITGGLYHQQYFGYSIPSEYYEMPWDRMVEDAAAELASGLAAEGYQLYVGRTGIENREVGGNWITYFDPVISGLKDDSFVRIRIVPEARDKASGPWLMVNIYTQSPKRIFEWSREDDRLEPVDDPQNTSYLLVLEGHYNSRDLPDGMQGSGSTRSHNYR